MYIISFAGMLGFLSVLLGAVGDHVFRSQLNELEWQHFTTALHYHQLYAILILVLGIAKVISQHKSMQIAFGWTGIIFMTGLVCFSGGLYVSLFTELGWVSYFTPVGGSLLMLGWVSLILLPFFVTRLQKRALS